MKYCMLAINGLKKKKGDTVAMFILIAVATIMMYIGLSVFTNLMPVLDAVNNQNNGADVLIATQCQDVKGMEKQIKGVDGVESLEVNESYYAFSGKYWRGSDEKEEMSFLVEDMDLQSEFFTPEILQKGEKIKDNSIILPYYLHVAKGYETGEIISIKVNDSVYECEIYGFMEDILFATPTNIAIFHVQAAPEMYEKMSEQMIHNTIFRVKSVSGTDTEALEGDITAALEKKVPEYQQYYNLSVNYQTMRFGDSLTADIIMAILVVFALIILVVAIVIVCFSIQNSIEQNMTNIGIMEASGFTTNQLIFATVLESLFVSLFSIGLALAVSPVFTKLVGEVVASSIGVRWQLGFDAKSAFITGITILLFILLATYIEARGYRKISILDALRGGVKTHNFRKNHIPMDKTFLPLSMALGIKGILNQKRKSIAICIMIMVLAIACSSGLFLYENFVYSQDNLLQLVGMERASAQIQIPEDLDIHEVGEDISDIDGVEQVNYFMSNTMKLSKGEVEESYSVDYWEDTDKIKVRTIVEGRYPLYDNEIAISRPISEKLGAEIGDMIQVNSADNTKEYLVVGITQHIEYLGKKAVMTFDGIHRVNDTINPGVLMIYTNDNVEFSTLENKIHELYPQLEVINEEQIIKSTCDPIADSLGILCVVFNICTVLIIVVILFLVIRMKLNQEKINMGVEKALGFTTRQLMIRVIMNYVPIVLVGAILGVIVSYFTFDSLTSTCLAFCGIRGCDMEKSMLSMLITIAIITVTSLVASSIMSVRIRKVEPRQMIRES